MSQVRNKLLTLVAILLEFGALIWYVLMYLYNLWLCTIIYCNHPSNREIETWTYYMLVS